MNAIFIFLLLILVAGSSQASEDEICQWDGLKKVIWIEDLNQHGTHMAYPLPHDLITRKLSSILSAEDKHMTNTARNQAQILISTKLLFSDFIQDSYLLGSGLGSTVKVSLQIDIIDNFSHTPIRTFDLNSTRRLWVNLLSNSQADLHEYTVKMIEQKMPELAARLDGELDCIPFATRVIRTEGKEMLIAGGSRNNIKPKMSFSILGYPNKANMMEQPDNNAYVKLSDIVVKAVSPSVATAVSEEALNTLDHDLVASYHPK